MEEKIKKNLQKRFKSIIIDVDNMIEDLRSEREQWKDRFEESDKLRLKELRSISKRLNGLYEQLK